MKCIIPGANIKILAKAIHALAKIGDEMYIEPQENGIVFRTVNMANSAYADFTFSQNFFTYYAYGDLQENDVLKCKISMRSAMTVFKAINVLEKQVETCHIKLEPDAAEILFLLKYKNGINKTYLLPILDCEILQTTYDKDNAAIKISSQPKVMVDAIQNFYQHLVEITLEVLSQKLLLRNYVDDSSGLSNATRTQLALGKGEFDRYDIGSETSITFCMKEFKSILSFAETVGAPISVYFERAGKPVIFALKNPSFEANLLLSTLSSSESQSESTITNAQERSTKKTTRNKQGLRKTNNNSTSKLQNTSFRTSSMSGSTALSRLHPCFTEDRGHEEQNTSNANVLVNLLTNAVNTSANSNQNINNEVISVPEERNILRDSHDSSSSHSDTSARLSEVSISRKRLINTVFSSITKGKSSKDEIGKQNLSTDECNVSEDKIPNSPVPPNKKARLIFQKCFQRTFDPTTLPGYDIILAEDSDE